MKQTVLIFSLLILFFDPTIAQDSKENADFKLAVNLFNDKLFDGTMTLHEAKSLIRIIGDMAAYHADCLVIQSCLTRISKRCQILGLEAMAYEARTLSDRLTEQSADQGCVGP